MLEMPQTEGFIEIHPQLKYETHCPLCDSNVRASDWSIPGLWNLAKIYCYSCKKHFWTDFPFGVGVLAPCFVDIDSGETIRPDGPQWYADLTATAWRKSTRKNIEIQVETRYRAKHICLVNCLYPWWGDAVSLLLRINQVRRSSDLDIVVVITSNLRWLVPDYVAEVWTIETEFSTRNESTCEWNLELSEKIRALVSAHDSCYIPVIFQPAHLTQAELIDFTDIQPFPRHEWNQRLESKPTVTFMWRSERCWSGEPLGTRWLDSRIGRSWVLRPLSQSYKRQLDRQAIKEQLRRVITLANELKAKIPNLDFGVCGIGKAEKLPAWITDLRSDAIGPGTNQLWCQRGSQSHVLIGVHGSNINLPSGHAGAVLELVPSDKLRNVLTTFLVTCEDPREALYCYRWLPLDTDPHFMSKTILSILYNYSYMHDAFHGEYYKPLTQANLGSIKLQQHSRRRALQRVSTPSEEYLIGP